MSATYPVEVYIEFLVGDPFFYFLGHLIYLFVYYLFFVPDKKYKVSSSFSLLEIIYQKNSGTLLEYRF